MTRQMITKYGIIFGASAFGGKGDQEVNQYDKKMEIIEDAARNYEEQCLMSEGIRPSRKTIKPTAELVKERKTQADTDWKKTQDEMKKAEEEKEKKEGKKLKEPDLKKPEDQIKKSDLTDEEKEEAYNMIETISRGFSVGRYRALIKQFEEEDEVDEKILKEIRRYFKKRLDHENKILLYEKAEKVTNKASESTVLFNKGNAFMGVVNTQIGGNSNVRKTAEALRQSVLAGIKRLKEKIEEQKIINGAKMSNELLVQSKLESVYTEMGSINNKITNFLKSRLPAGLITTMGKSEGLGGSAGITLLRSYRKRLSEMGDLMIEFRDLVKEIKFNEKTFGGSFLARSFGDMIKLYKNVGKSIIKGDVKGVANAFIDNAKQLPVSLYKSAMDLPDEIGMLLDKDVSGILKSEFKQATGGKINAKQIFDMKRHMKILKNQIEGGSEESIKDMISEYGKMGLALKKGNFHKLPEMWMNVINKHVTKGGSKGGSSESVIGLIESANVLPTKVIKDLKKRGLTSASEILNHLKDKVQKDIVNIILGGAEETEEEKKKKRPIDYKSRSEGFDEIKIGDPEETEDKTIIKFQPQARKSKFCKQQRDRIVAEAKKALLVYPGKDIDELQWEIMEHLLKHRKK